MMQRVFVVVLLMGFAAVGLGQNVRGALGGGGLVPDGSRVPYLGSEAVDAAIAWSRAPESVELRARWLRSFHRSLVVAVPEVGQYAADDLCGYVGGSGGTSKLDGGGWLEALNPREFDPVLDSVSIATAAGLFDAAPSRLVVIDEFELGAIARAVAASSDGDAEHLFLTSGIVWPTARGYEVVHGHLVVHHVARLLEQKGLRLSTTVELRTDSGVSSARLTFGGIGRGDVVVDLFNVAFDDLGSQHDALVAVAESAVTDGGAAVVLSWSLTGCSLRDAFAVRSTRADGLTVVTEYVSLSDFAVAVATAYDQAATESGATPDTSVICEAVDAFSGGAVRRSSAIGCRDRDVRVLVATTVLFTSYATNAASAVQDVEAQERVVFADAHAYFAAAGNEGLPYPMPPASFDRVTAVAACKPTGPERALFSNAGDWYAAGEDAGEVIALGAWFPARLPATESAAVGYWGTSFAAPLAALASGSARLGGEAKAPTFANLCEPARRSEPAD